VETKNQGTDHQVANVRETGDGGIDRCVFAYVLNSVHHATYPAVTIREGLGRKTFIP